MNSEEGGVDIGHICGDVMQRGEKSVDGDMNEQPDEEVGDGQGATLLEFWKEHCNVEASVKAFISNNTDSRKNANINTTFL